VDCKSVGSGEPALIYLGRYLYRGVLRENDIVACKDGQVSFRYRNAKTERRNSEPFPARFSCGWSCSMCCRKVFGGRAISAFCTPTASASSPCCTCF
jgi:hypothetical protein